MKDKMRQQGRPVKYNIMQRRATRGSDNSNIAIKIEWGENSVAVNAFR